MKQTRNISSMNANDKQRVPNVLLCCSGSVATVKVPEIAYRLSLLPANVLIVVTKASLHFLYRAKNYDPVSWANFESIGGMNLVFSDDMEWSLWDAVGDMVLHIELRRWADCVVIAPMSANTLAKITAGVCDNMLLSLLRAIYRNRPRIFCPAMNTHMYSHPITKKHIELLVEDNWTLVEPVEKALACGDVGSGALAKVPCIVSQVERSVQAWRLSCEKAIQSGSVQRREELETMEKETTRSTIIMNEIVQKMKSSNLKPVVKDKFANCTQSVISSNSNMFQLTLVVVAMISGICIGYGFRSFRYK